MGQETHILKLTGSYISASLFRVMKKFLRKRDFLNRKFFKREICFKRDIFANERFFKGRFI